METDHVKDALNISKKTEKGFSEVIDCSLQSKDFVSELSADIDLDEACDFDSAEEKGSIETGTDGIAKEQNNAVGDDNDETEIKDETNIRNGENLEVLTCEIDQTGLIPDKNKEESCCGIDDIAMGNKIEGDERMESNVDGDCNEQDRGVNNESGVEDIKVNSEGMIDGKEDSAVSQSESNEESENPEENVLHIVEDSDKNPSECEVNIVDQQENIESHEKINSIGHDISVEKHEDVQEEIDREKIKSFIEEVINDLQGIVIETEECDNIVEGICLENESSDVNNLREGNFDMDLNVTENEDGNQNDQSDTKDCLDEAVNKSDEYDNTNNEKHWKDDSGVISNDVKETANNIVDKNVLEKDESLEKEVVTKVSSGLLEHQNTTDVTIDKDETSEKLKKSTGTIPKGAKDIAMIEEDLQGTRAALQASQSCLQNERAKHIQEVMRLKLLLYRSQTDLKHQRMKSDKQMTEIMSQLVLLESRLRREKRKVKSELKSKEDVIEIQKKEIVKLKDQNVQLLNAIKEICANGGMNGYMRENKRKNGNYSDGFDSGGKGGRGKLGTMKDKFMAKNRSSMELSNINLEKYLIKNQRMCSSQEDLQRAVEDERRRSIPNSDTNFNGTQRLSISPVERPLSDGIEYKNGKHRKNPKYHHQNFFNDGGSPNYEMNKSVSESSYLSESTTSSSGVYSLSEHDLSTHDISMANGQPYNHDQDDDDGDDRIFSFSSTHINTVINEEEALGPIMSHSGQMMSMGSMPMLANLKDEHRLGAGKDRPHSLSNVDLVSIQQQAKHLEKLGNKSSPLTIPVMEMKTPPASPSSHNKPELTPFQTFKTMFRRSKNKGHKKRSVSLSQTTNTEYSEALKKHFQKYDMS